MLFVWIEDHDHGTVEGISEDASLLSELEVEVPSWIPEQNSERLRVAIELHHH